MILWCYRFVFIDKFNWKTKYEGGDRGEWIDSSASGGGEEVHLEKIQSESNTRGVACLELEVVWGEGQTVESHSRGEAAGQAEYTATRDQSIEEEEAENH